MKKWNETRSFPPLPTMNPVYRWDVCLMSEMNEHTSLLFVLFFLIRAFIAIKMNKQIKEQCERINTKANHHLIADEGTRNEWYKREGGGWAWRWCWKGIKERNKWRKWALISLLCSRPSYYLCGGWERNGTKAWNEKKRNKWSACSFFHFILFVPSFPSFLLALFSLLFILFTLHWNKAKNKEVKGMNERVCFSFTFTRSFPFSYFALFRFNEKKWKRERKRQK